MTKKNQKPSAGNSGLSSKKDDWLLLYILGVANLAFTGRAAPLSFLPLVLKTDFHQPEHVIGLVMAVYPLAALLTTPWAARRARAAKRIVTMHSLALITIALAMVLTSLAEMVSDRFGTLLGVFWIVASRAVQGVGASLYLSSNTSLITRKFPDRLPYVIAMTEVAVGSGGQIGRLAGGFLFDFGGFACPFIVISFLQCAMAIIGFAFEDGDMVQPDASVDEDSVSQPREKLPWSSLITPRLCVGALGAFMQYFVGCFGDATLLQYLDVHLAPISVGSMSLVMSSRGLTYLTASFCIAQLMHRELISFERLVAFGASLAFLGQILMAPQPCVSSLEAWYEGGAHVSRVSLFGTEILAMVVAQMGGAFMFVPSLPLMQTEVHQYGDFAIEQVAELFVTMMTLGEMLGPIVGGWLVGLVGFTHGTLLLALTCLPLLVMAVMTYDPAVVTARRRLKQHPILPRQDSTNREECLCAPQCGAPGMVSDGEVNFAVRRIPFALAVARNRPSSAPGTPTGWRDIGKKSVQPQTVAQSAPAESFRRPYQPPAFR